MYRLNRSVFVFFPFIVNRVSLYIFAAQWCASSAYVVALCLSVCVCLSQEQHVSRAEKGAERAESRMSGNGAVSESAKKRWYRFCNTGRPPRHENTQTYRLPRKETLMSTEKKFRIPRNCCMCTHVLASAHIHTPTRTLMHRKHRLPRNQKTRMHSSEDKDSGQLLYNAHTSSQLRLCRASPSTEASRRARTGRLLPCHDDVFRRAAVRRRYWRSSCWSCRWRACRRVHVAVVCCVSCVSLFFQF